MLASLIVIMIIIGLIIYIMSTVGDSFAGFDLWPFNKPDPGTLDPGVGYLEGAVLYNGGNLPLWTFAKLNVGGQEQRINNYEIGIFPESYWFSLPVGTYTMEANMYSWTPWGGDGDVMASQNYTSIVIVSQTDTTRDVNFGGNS